MANLQNDADGEPACHREPIELPLVRSLWRWSDLAKDEPGHEPSALSEIAGWLGPFLTGVFRMSPSEHSQTWWSDGVLDVHVSQPTPTMFRLVGATIWAGYGTKFYVAPFECDFRFAAPQAAEAQSIAVRFGKRSGNGDIVRLGHDGNPESVIASRPTALSGWALAVELS